MGRETGMDIQQTIMILSEQIELYHLLKEQFGEKYDIFRHPLHGWQEEVMKEFFGNGILLLIIEFEDGFKEIMEMVNKIRLCAYTGFILLLSRTEERERQAEEKILAIDAGADEYLDGFQTKEEVLASVKAVLRRLNWKGDCVLAVRGRQFFMNIHNWQLEIDGKEILFTKTEFSILIYLIQHLNQTVSYKELYEAVWEKAYRKDDTNIMAHIHRMRRKMGDDTQNPLYIQNVYGIGYRIEGEMSMYM